MLAEFTGPTLLDVVTPHCVECRAMKPDLDAVAAACGDVDLVVIDATVEPEVATALGVFGTPTLIAVRDGVEIARFTGRRSKSELRELFAQVAAGRAVTAARLSGSDRLLWTLGGVGLLAVGLLTGPIWPLAALGALATGYANLRRKRSASSARRVSG